MATPLEYITRWVPSYGALPDINDWIQEADDETGEYCDEETRNKVIAAKVCHELALNDRDGGDSGNGSSVGSVKSEKEGDLARSYGSVTNSDSTNDELYYSQTRWGLKVLGYRNKCFMLPRNRFV